MRMSQDGSGGGGYKAPTNVPDSTRRVYRGPKSGLKKAVTIPKATTKKNGPRRWSGGTV